MKLRSVTFVFPLLLAPSLALAQPAPSSPAAGTSDEQAGSRVTKSDTKKSDTEKKSDTGNKSDTEKKRKTQKAAPEEGTTILGRKFTNEDDDLDVRVSRTRTTSAEPPRRDVIESRAEEVRKVEGRQVSVAPLLGYGTNDLNLGLGLRGGYTFKPAPIYVGGTFLYHFGADRAALAPGIIESSQSLYYPAAEVGYDIGIGPVLVRPYGGAGLLFARSSVSSGGATVSDTTSALMIYPGATAQYLFPGSPIFVGGDVRLLLPFEKESASLSLFATSGLKL